MLKTIDINDIKAVAPDKTSPSVVAFASRDTDKQVAWFWTHGEDPRTGFFSPLDEALETEESNGYDSLVEFDQYEPQAFRACGLLMAGWTEDEDGGHYYAVCKRPKCMPF